MTPEYLPWIVTLYCAVCRCYYDNRAAVKAEVNPMSFESGNQDLWSIDASEGSTVAASETDLCVQL